MATAQTHLNASLRALKDPAAAVAEVNRYVCLHASKGKFISLWLGVFDPVTGDVWFVDAGHGHWLVVTQGGTGGPEVRRVAAEGGMLIGVDRDYQYKAEHLKLKPGERVVLFSDGVVEQAGPDGELFGLNAAIAALRSSSGCASDVTGLFDAVVSHAQTDSLQDDTTVASVGFLPRAPG
jgi:sigma-B regulation protein RsbU (phosphoserine phosphatase)